MSLGFFHIFTRLALNSIEPFETKIAEDCSSNAKQRKEDSCSFKPPIDHLRSGVNRLCSVVEKLLPQFIETAFGLDVGGGRIAIRRKRHLFLFRFVATRLGFDTIRLDFGTAGSIDGRRFLRLSGEDAHRYCEHE